MDRNKLIIDQKSALISKTKEESKQASHELDVGNALRKRQYLYFVASKSQHIETIKVLSDIVRIIMLSKIRMRQS